MRFFIVTLLLFSAGIHASVAANKTDYPRDAVKTYLTSCIGGAQELVKPCVCVLRQFQTLLPFNQFVALATSPNATRDPRFTTIMNNCGRRHSNKRG